MRTSSLAFPANAVFRRLGRDDARAMWQLELRCFALPWSEEQCRAAFAQPAFLAFGSFHLSRLLAYISLYHVAGELEILNLAVEPEARRRGLGRRALNLVLRMAYKMGITTSWLEVRASNAAAIALYASCGFRPAGRRVGYYGDNGEDALIYKAVPGVPPV